MLTRGSYVLTWGSNIQEAQISQLSACIVLTKCTNLAKTCRLKALMAKGQLGQLEPQMGQLEAQIGQFEAQVGQPWGPNEPIWGSNGPTWGSNRLTWRTNAQTWGSNEPTCVSNGPSWGSNDHDEYQTGLLEELGNSRLKRADSKLK